MKRDALLTVPNVVSLSRLVLAVAFVVTPGAWARVAVIAAAGATDVLDGWMARRHGSVTRTGALIDPIADRVFVITAFTVYLVEGIITPVEYGILLARDFATVLGFFVARIVPSLRAAVFQARPLGKAVTVLQLTFLVVVLIVPTIGRLALDDILIFAIAVVSAAAIADYTTAVWRARTR